MANVLYIGNRPNVFEEITKIETLDFVRIFALANSLLQGELKNRSYEYTIFDTKDKEYIIREISKTDFDILISSGCPFIIPVSKIRKPHQLFINTHPSLLPDLGGFHPANGALLYGRKVTGATMHYMDDGLDTGKIVYQAKIDITSDLDLGLIYQMIFDLEAKVFAIGMKRVIEANLDYEGKSQTGNRSYYTQSEKDMILDFHSMSNDELITRIKAFGIKSQGASCVIDKVSYKVFDAETIFNQYFLDKYSGYQCGSLLLKYDDKLLVKTRDGIMKIKSYREL